MPRTTLKPSLNPQLIVIIPIKRIPLAAKRLRAVTAGIRE